MKFSLIGVAFVLSFSSTGTATDSQYFFQARKNQFYLTPVFAAAHEDYGFAIDGVPQIVTTRRDYGMNFFGEYGLSDSMAVEAGIGAAYNTFLADVLSTYQKKVSYISANAIFLRLKGRADVPALSFRYGLDTRIAMDSEAERALWDWGTTVSPYMGIQTAYDNGVVGMHVSIDAFRTSRKYVSGWEVPTASAPEVKLYTSSVEGGQRVRLVFFAEGDDRKFDVGIGLGIEHHLEATREGLKFRFVENNIFLRGYFVYEFLPKVNFVLDAIAVVGEKEKRIVPPNTFEELRRNHVNAMAGVRMEL